MQTANPIRISHIYVCFDESKHHPTIENLYFFPFTGNTSQGYAGDPNNRGGNLTDSNYAVVGFWSNKHNQARMPESTLIQERLNNSMLGVPPQLVSNYFNRGSIGRTCAYELGHNLGLKHPSRDVKGRLMGGGRPRSDFLNPEEIAKARARRDSFEEKR